MAPDYRAWRSKLIRITSGRGGFRDRSLGFFFRIPVRSGAQTAQVVDRGSGAKDVPARLTWGAARPFPLPRRRQMKIPAPWPQSLDFFRTPLVIEPSAGQLS